MKVEIWHNHRFILRWIFHQIKRWDFDDTKIYLFSVWLGLILSLMTTKSWYFVLKIVLIIYSNSEMSDQFCSVFLLLSKLRGRSLQIFVAFSETWTLTKYTFNMFLEVPIWSNRLEQLKCQLEQIITYKNKLEEACFSFDLNLVSWFWILKSDKSCVNQKLLNIIYEYKSSLIHILS